MSDHTLPADSLTVVHHDDTTTTFDNVRYSLTRAGLRVFDAAGAETTLSNNDVLTVHTVRHHTGGER